MSRLERRRGLVAAIACVSVAGIAMGLTYPLLSLILEARGTSRTLIGLNAAMPALAMLIFSPLIPRLATAAGIKPFILACLVTEASMVLLLKTFDGLAYWFPIRFVMGASVVGLFVASETWINQLAVERSRGRLMAVYNMILSAGFVLGPLLILVTGIEGWAPFLVGAAFIAAAVVPLVWGGGAVPALTGRSSFGVLAFIRIAPSLAAAVLVMSVVEGAAGSLLPVYGVRSGFSADLAVVMLSTLLMGSIALQLPVGWLADKVDRYRVMVACGAGAAVGAVLIPFAVASGLLLWPVLFLWGGFVAGIYTVAMTIVGERFRGAELITANAAFGVLWGLGGLVGPSLAGVAMDLWDPHGLMAVLAASCFLFVALTAFRQARRQGRGT